MHIRCLFLLLPALFGGTAQGQVPYLVRNINTAFLESSDPEWITPFGAGVAFTARTDAQGTELWTSDGTTAGTLLLKDLLPGPAHSDPRDLVPVGASLYCTSEIGRKLWVSDGTTLGTTTVISFPTIGAIMENGLVGLNGSLLFAVNGAGPVDELWVTNGTMAGTTLLHAFEPLNSAGIEPNTFFVHQGVLYFLGSDAGLGRELWRSDGTVAGTVLVKDIHTEAQNSSDFWDPHFITYNDTLFFTANSVGYDNELYKTDGTEAGTVRVRDINPGAGGSDIRDITIVNGLLFFPALVNGTPELWVSDGTEQGTHSVTEVHDPHGLIALGDVLVYTDDMLALNAGRELWKSDGTSAGTQLIADIRPGAEDGVLWDGTYFQEANGILYFRGNDGMSGEELWRTDGTAAGTQLVKDLYPGPADGFINNATWSLPMGDHLLFDAVNANLGNTIPELWISDGSNGGTYRLTINSFGDGSLPGLPVRAGELVFFAATNELQGRELWAFTAAPLTTDINDHVARAHLHLYPVPTSEDLVVQVPEGLSYPMQYQAIDAQGRSVLQGRFGPDGNRIDIRSLDAGMYVLHLIDARSAAFTASFISQ